MSTGKLISPDTNGGKAVSCVANHILHCGHCKSAEDLLARFRSSCLGVHA